jgi:tellurite resistance protein TerC
MPFRTALIWSLAWIGLSLLTAAGIYQFYGAELAMAFLAGYAIEKALSVDNLFVFLMLFSHFKVGQHAQRRVLNYGIIGVLVLRGILIFFGIALVNQFEWLMYVFGVIVIYTGVVMAFGRETEFDPNSNRIIRWTRKLIPVSNHYDGDRFFSRHNGHLLATPLFVVLVVVEITDLLFAVDSIPAIFSVSRDPMIVYSSNMLAVLGLRSLYFLLERAHEIFRFVKKGVGIILWFVGVKMILPLVYHEAHISTAVSLSVVLGILAISIVASVLLAQQTEEEK